MRYVKAKCNEADRAETYRIYVTDVLKILSGVNERYYDFVKPAPEETRSADEIIQGITDKLAQLGGE